MHPAMGGGNDDQKRKLDMAIDDAVRELNATLAMLRSHTSDRPTLGDQLSSYGRRYLPVDGKVRAVGHALLNAATAGALPVDRKDPGYLPSISGSVVTMDSAKLDPFLQTAQQQEAALEKSEESV